MKAAQHTTTTTTVFTALNTFTSVTACPNQECTATDHLGFLSATFLGTHQQVKAQDHSNRAFAF